MRLRKPISQKMWRNSQNSHANQSGRSHRTDVDDRRAAADRRHVAVVAIAERLERLRRGSRADVARGMRALLLRHLRDAGQRLAVLLKRTDVADDEDLRMPARRASARRRRGRRDRAARRATRAKRRRRDAGRPENGLRGNPLASRRSTPSSSTAVTAAPVRTSTPSLSSDRVPPAAALGKCRAARAVRLRAAGCAPIRDGCAGSRRAASGARSRPARRPARPRSVRRR